MAMSGQGYGAAGDADALIVEMLDEAVPVLMAELVKLDDAQRWDRMMAWRAAATQVLAEGGDVLRFGSTKTGEVAALFSALARGLAALACCPGGVTFAGRHWCGDHALCQAADREASRRLGEAA